MSDATRRTLRTTLEVIVALAAMVPVLVSTIGLDTTAIPALAGIVAVAAAITRIAALPAVEEFLQTWLPWLAAESSGRHEL